MQLHLLLRASHVVSWRFDTGFDYNSIEGSMHLANSYFVYARFCWEILIWGVTFLTLCTHSVGAVGAQAGQVDWANREFGVEFSILQMHHTLYENILACLL
jgi:hypothetical protein